MAFLKIPSRKKEPKDFLLIEIGLEVVNIAKLSLEPELRIEEVGRKKFTTLNEMFDASLEAMDELAGKISDIPKTALLGVSGGPIKTETTVAQYVRPEPNDPVSGEEVEKVLEEVSSKEKPGDLKLFFSTIASATIDGTKVSNPTGIKGEKAALSCFIAYKHPGELEVFDKLIDEIDMDLGKIIPTSFAVAKMMLKKGDENSLMWRLGTGRSEIASLSKGHIDRIVQFDLGASNSELLLTGFELILEDLIKESKPDLIWLYPDSYGIDISETMEKLSEVPWKDYGFDKAPHVDIAREEGDKKPEDTGLSALSSEATL